MSERCQVKEAVAHSPEPPLTREARVSSFSWTGDWISGELHSPDNQAGGGER